MELNDIYSRTESVLGAEKLNRIKKSNICICGIGGVGSYTLEALARMGVSQLTIIDKDIVDITNINRQIIANVENVGNPKVEEAKKRIHSINPGINVFAIQDTINNENINKYITEKFDYVVDAIDDVEAKISLIKRCKEINVPIISSMGTANKLDPLKLKVTDISKTEMCPLAKIVRKKLRQEGIDKVKVVYSTEQAVKTNTNILGSVSYVPSVAGLIIASEIINDIIK